MVADNTAEVRFPARRLDYGDACMLARSIAAGSSRVVHIHLEQTSETSTAALARLIVLRQRMLASGRDLDIVGLSGRAEALYEISRLGRLLPRVAGAEA